MGRVRAINLSVSIGLSCAPHRSINSNKHNHAAVVVYMYMYMYVTCLSGSTVGVCCFRVGGGPAPGGAPESEEARLHGVNARRQDHHGNVRHNSRSRLIGPSVGSVRIEFTHSSLSSCFTTKLSAFRDVAFAFQ